MPPSNLQTPAIQAPASNTSVTHSRGQILVIPLVMAVLATLVALFANSYWISTLTSAVALALAVTGVSILYGQLGLVSLCQLSLVGVGGWVTLRIGHSGMPFEISLLSGGLIASLIGLVFGIPALRLRGLYLSLVTLMLAGGFYTVISAWGFPDGGDGFFGRAEGFGRQMLAKPSIARKYNVANFIHISVEVAYFIYVCAVATICLALARLHRFTRPGRAWALIRKGETVAAASGVNVLLFKAWAFALSGFLAGIAGGLLAGHVGQLDGASFSAAESLELFALAVVGGVYHWYGALIAGLLMRALPSLLTDLGVDGYIAIGIFGIGLFQALATAPSGIAGQIAVLIDKLRARLFFMRHRESQQ